MLCMFCSGKDGKIHFSGVRVAHENGRHDFEITTDDQIASGTVLKCNKVHSTLFSFVQVLEHAH